MCWCVVKRVAKAASTLDRPVRIGKETYRWRCGKNERKKSVKAGGFGFSSIRKYKKTVKLGGGVVKSERKKSSKQVALDLVR